jgi:hypothetical protein
VLVFRAVPLTLLPTEVAGSYARVEHLSDDLFIRASAAVCDHRSCAADVGTIEVQADALAEMRDHLLGQARVGA